MDSQLVLRADALLETYGIELLVRELNQGNERILPWALNGKEMVDSVFDVRELAFLVVVAIPRLTPFQRRGD